MFLYLCLIMFLQGPCASSGLHGDFVSFLNQLFIILINFLSPSTFNLQIFYSEIDKPNFRICLLKSNLGDLDSTGFGDDPKLIVCFAVNDVFEIGIMSLRSKSTAEKITEDDPVTYKTAQSSVTCIYQAHIIGFWRNVRVLWSKNLMNHSLTVMITSVQGDMNYCCKVDLKPWHFWNKKGYKSLEVDGNQIDVYWDFRSAKFNNGPEPSSDFYVALVAEEEVVLLLGDHKKKAFKRTKSRPSLVDAALFYKKENVFGKKSFLTRAKFHDRKKEHEIVVESSGTKDPEMWISIDGMVLVQVRNLQWKFRGNQTVLVDKEPVQVFWDVYDWLFSTPGTGHGLFIFKPENENDGGESETSKISASSSSPEFCLFLYAWKLE